jgi:hypothetical protein
MYVLCACMHDLTNPCLFLRMQVPTHPCRFLHAKSSSSTYNGSTALRAFLSVARLSRYISKAVGFDICQVMGGGSDMRCDFYYLRQWSSLMGLLKLLIHPPCINFATPQINGLETETTYHDHITRNKRRLRLCAAKRTSLTARM